MSYDIRLVKLVTGETVIGKFSENKIEEPAVIQTVPAQQGVQIMLLPYGYPFDQEMRGELSMTHVIFEYKSCPEDLKTKYLEATSNITLSSGGALGDLDKMAGGTPDLSSLLKK